MLSIRPFSENARIVRLFNKSIGVTSGLVRGMKSAIQPGDISDVLWKGRLPEQLGTLKVENVFSPFPYVLNSALGVAMIDSACALCSSGLPERAPHAKLFDLLVALFKSVEHDHWLANYALFELAFLSEVGMGLDFSKCAVTGERTDLSYVSPKTGRAVTKQVGDQYKEKLFVLPDFFRSNEVRPRYVDVFDALKITGHFLKQFFYGINNTELPLSREILISNLYNKLEKEECYEN